MTIGGLWNSMKLRKNKRSLKYQALKSTGHQLISDFMMLFGKLGKNTR